MITKKIILTGASGMAGEGVLQECLDNDNISQILVIGRRSCGISHEKLIEIIHKNFNDISSISHKLEGYDACLFCSGVSSIGMNESKFIELTYDLTINFAKILLSINPKMIFCYISGFATDSTEKGKIMRARVKGKTENDLMKLGFYKVYNFRPRYMHPDPNAKNVKKIIKLFSFLYPILNKIIPQYLLTLSKLGKAMINCITTGYDKNILEIEDIQILSNR